MTRTDFLTFYHACTQQPTVLENDRQLNAWIEPSLYRNDPAQENPKAALEWVAELTSLFDGDMDLAILFAFKAGAMLFGLPVRCSDKLCGRFIRREQDDFVMVAVGGGQTRLYAPNNVLPLTGAQRKAQGAEWPALNAYFNLHYVQQEEA